MSAANSADKRLLPTQRLAAALLNLFELLVANARDAGDNIAELEAWADEFKPQLEGLIRNGTSKTKLPKE